MTKQDLERWVVALEGLRQLSLRTIGFQTCAAKSRLERVHVLRISFSRVVVAFGRPPRASGTRPKVPRIFRERGGGESPPFGIPGLREPRRRSAESIAFAKARRWILR